MQCIEYSTETNYGVNLYMYDSHVLVVFLNSGPALKGNNCFCSIFHPPSAFSVKLVFVVRKECALLNRGACGEVKVAFSKGNCERFAVKMISKKKFTIGGVNQIVSRKNGGQFANVVQVPVLSSWSTSI